MLILAVLTKYCGPNSRTLTVLTKQWFLSENSVFIRETVSFIRETVFISGKLCLFSVLVISQKTALFYGQFCRFCQTPLMTPLVTPLWHPLTPLLTTLKPNEHVAWPTRWNQKEPGELRCSAWRTRWRQCGHGGGGWWVPRVVGNGDGADCWGYPWPPSGSQYATKHWRISQFFMKFHDFHRSFMKFSVFGYSREKAFI